MSCCVFPVTSDMNRRGAHVMIRRYSHSLFFSGGRTTLTIHCVISLLISETVHGGARLMESCLLTNFCCSLELEPTSFWEVCCVAFGNLTERQ